ncbi:glycosyl transferase [Paracoccus sp. S-4012]|nr:glycosyl transferase [Paracoccus sp. S-4012]
MRLGVVMLCHTQMNIAARMARHWAAAGAAVAVHIDAQVGVDAAGAFRAQLEDLPDIHYTARRNCEWGMFSLVEATQEAAATLLARHPDVTHVLLVSGACLPLRPVEDLIAWLALDPARDYIESVTAADVGWTVGGLNQERFTLRFPFSWRRHRKLFDRYVALQRRLGVRRRIPQGVVPHLGSQWWCLTRRTITAILDDPRRGEFDRYFRRVWIPDESYFQTLARRHSTTIESRSLTLSKFDTQGKPYIFYDDHRDMLEASGCFVARKIWPRANALLEHFPRPATLPPSAAEPQPGHIDRLVTRAVARRALGRPGLYMQSRFPRKDSENGKTAARYAVFQGFDDVFPGFRDWLAARVEADVHGHLFSQDRVEFADDAEVGPGCLSSSAAQRRHDPQGFLTSLIRITAPRLQVLLLSPRDDHRPLDWFVATDPNALIFVVTGAWVLPLMGSDMPFDDIRRVGAQLQAREEEQLSILRSVWVKARVHVWELADFLARPAAILHQSVQELAEVPLPGDDLPAMRPVDGIGAFLQSLRNAGLQPRLMGDFPAPRPAIRE